MTGNRHRTAQWVPEHKGLATAVDWNSSSHGGISNGLSLFAWWIRMVARLHWWAYIRDEGGTGSVSGSDCERTWAVRFFCAGVFMLGQLLWMVVGRKRRWSGTGCSEGGRSRAPPSRACQGDNMADPYCCGWCCCLIVRAKPRNRYGNSQCS